MMERRAHLIAPDDYYIAKLQDPSFAWASRKKAKKSMQMYQMTVFVKWLSCKIFKSMYNSAWYIPSASLEVD